MWDFLRDVLKRHGFIAILLLAVGYLLYWQMKQSAEERKNFFDTTMDYVMDVRVKLTELSKGCGGSVPDPRSAPDPKGTPDSPSHR